jgi:hypothetical protein
MAQKAHIHSLSLLATVVEAPYQTPVWDLSTFWTYATTSLFLRYLDRSWFYQVNQTKINQPAKFWPCNYCGWGYISNARFWMGKCQKLMIFKLEILGSMKVLLDRTRSKTRESGLFLSVALILSSQYQTHVWCWVLQTPVQSTKTWDIDLAVDSIR